MKADSRIWRTADGDLVEEQHPGAAFLAYAVGDEVAPPDVDRLPGAKARPVASNKAAKRTADKGA